MEQHQKGDEHLLPPRRQGTVVEANVQLYNLSVYEEMETAWMCTPAVECLTFLERIGELRGCGPPCHVGDEVDSLDSPHRLKKAFLALKFLVCLR